MNTSSIFSARRSRNPFVFSLVLLAGAGAMHEAQAAPTCGSIIVTPADGQILAGTVITNSAADACFDNGAKTIYNRGGLVNNVGASLTNVGKLYDYKSTDNYGIIVNDVAGTYRQSAQLNNYSGALVKNDGTFLFTSSSAINFSGATIENRAAMSINRINNKGLLKNVAGAALTFYNAGIITNEAGGTIVNDGELNNGAKIVNEGTITNNAGGVINTRAGLKTVAGATLNNFGTINNIRDVAGGASTPAVAMVVEGTLDNEGAITNSSYITVAAGGTLGGSGTLVQTAGELIVNGTLSQSSVSILGGRLSGSGLIESDVVVRNSSLVVGAFNTAGHLTVDGDLDVAGSIANNIYFNVIGTDEGQFDVLEVTGDLTLTDVGLVFFFEQNVLQAGNSWVVLRGDTSRWSLNNLQFIFETGGATIKKEFVDGGVRLTVLTPVPVPASAWLFGSALVGLVAGVRRKSTAV